MKKTANSISQTIFKIPENDMVKYWVKVQNRIFFKSSIFLIGFVWSIRARWRLDIWLSAYPYHFSIIKFSTLTKAKFEVSFPNVFRFKKNFEICPIDCSKKWIVHNFWKIISNNIQSSKLIRYTSKVQKVHNVSQRLEKLNFRAILIKLSF